MVGKPVVRGTRIPVERVLAHLADNPELSDLFEALPRLTLEDVRACLEIGRCENNSSDRGRIGVGDSCQLPDLRAQPIFYPLDSHRGSSIKGWRFQSL